MKTLFASVFLVLSMYGLAACGHSQSAARQSSSPAISGIKVTRDNGDNTASANIGNCQASLEYRTVEPYTILYRNECTQPLADKLALLGNMVDALFGKAGLPRELTSMYIGRIDTTFPEFGQRIALEAANKSDRKLRNAREEGHVNSYFTDIAGDKDNYEELADLFKNLGYDIVGVSVEKIMVGTPSQTPFAAFLQDKGIDADHEFPYDALTWFKLRPQPKPDDDDKK